MESKIIIDKIQTDIQKYANKEYALYHSKFFQTHKGGYGEGDIFLGLRVPQMHKIAKEHYLQTSCDSLMSLFSSKIHEERFVAFDILVHKMKRATSKKYFNTEEQLVIYNTYINNIAAANNWDIVDLSAKDISGYYWYHARSMAKTPNIDNLNEYAPNTNKLWEYANSGNLWLERVSIISTYYFIHNKRYDETIQLAIHFKGHKHDLIHKATGWMLREVGKQDEEILICFLDTYANKLPRTTLRYAIERFTQRQRKVYLAK